MQRGSLEQRITGLIDTGLVCPEPKAWHRLWLHITALAEGPVPLPLILAAWHTTSDAEKTERLVEQLSIADRQGLGDAMAEALVAIPHTEWRKRRVSGVVEINDRYVPRAGTALTPQAVHAHACQRLAPLKRPRYVVLVDSLPHTGSMKIAKFRLQPADELLRRATDFQVEPHPAPQP